MKKKKIFILCFILVCLTGLVYSIYNIIIYKMSNDKTIKIQNEINKIIVNHDNNIDSNSDEESDTSYNIDFQKLKEMNKDVVAYLKVLGTNIDYVIVKGNDNDYYLNHNFNKEYSVIGWPFADYRNKFDGTDKNIIIYGHNIKTGSMFGTLKTVLEKKWQNNLENRKIIFITENESSIYEVFSTYIVEPEMYYISTNFETDNKYQTFLNELITRSNYNYNINVNTSDTILTLSSCTTGGKKRVVLHAKKVLSEINN